MFLNDLKNNLLKPTDIIFALIVAIMIFQINDTGSFVGKPNPSFIQFTNTVVQLEETIF